MVQFLSNEIRADGLKVVVYNRYCSDGNTLNCETSINKGNVSEEIKFAILKKLLRLKISKILRRLKNIVKKPNQTWYFKKPLK